MVRTWNWLLCRTVKLCGGKQVRSYEWSRGELHIASPEQHSSTLHMHNGLLNDRALGLGT